MFYLSRAGRDKNLNHQALKNRLLFGWIDWLFTLRLSAISCERAVDVKIKQVKNIVNVNIKKVRNIFIKQFILSRQSFE